MSVVNYSPEQVAQIKDAYTADPSDATVAKLAVALGKSARSVIAKLSKEGVYVSKAKPDGKRVMLKAEMVTEIAALVGATDEQVESLEKATGPALMFVLKALKA